MTRERLTFGHGMHVAVPRASAATAALPGEAAPVRLSHPETWDWAWAGLVVFTITVFFRPQDQIKILSSSHLSQISALIGLAAMMAGNLSRGRPITRVTPELIGLAILGIVIGITIPLSFWPGGAFDVFQTLYVPVLLSFVLMINTMNSPRRVERIVWIIVVSFGYMSARTSFDYMRGVNVVDGRVNAPVGGFFQNPNDLALNLASKVFTLKRITLNVPDFRHVPDRDPLARVSLLGK